MGRPNRLKMEGEPGFYHCVSRTVGQQFLLGDLEKETLVQIFKHYAKLYFVKVIGYAILSNHFHLVLKTEPAHMYEDEEVKTRIIQYVKARPSELNSWHIQKYREKLENLSEYIRSVKQTFSRWYNKGHNRTGYLWSDRFKSVILEPGKSLATCLTYVELNPLRAGLVQIPEDYRWCSLSYRLAKGHKDSFLHFDGVFDLSYDDWDKVGEAEARRLENLSYKEKLARYRYLVYSAGVSTRLTLADIEVGRKEDPRPRIATEVYDKELERHFSLPDSELMMKRIRYFSEGLVVGSKDFIRESYDRFAHIIKKKDRKGHSTGVSEGLLAMRNLRGSSP